MLNPSLDEQPLTEQQHADLLDWVKRLESGSYKPGQSSLKQGLSDSVPLYCCLGVAAEICVEQGKASWRFNTLVLPADRPVNDAEEDYTESRAYLPGYLPRLFGLNRRIGDGLWNYEQRRWVEHQHPVSTFLQLKYAHMNDSGATFAEIAAEIRQDFNLGSAE